MYKNLKKQKKAIVFGGSGFLGSHLCDVLSDNSFIVTIFDVKKSKYLRDDQKFICAVGFEPNVIHNDVLTRLQDHYQACGWRVG